MKLFFLFACSFGLLAQTTVRTPNLGLYVPAHGSLDWDTYYNANWSILDKSGSVSRISTNFPGADCGAQINAAYADLPAAGGKIVVPTSCTFATPIVFGAANKVAILEGVGNPTTLTYTGTTGTAVTFDNGILFDMSSGMRDLTLIGPGVASTTTGVQFGGTRGCVGCAIEHSRIQAFGTGLHLSTFTWNTSFYQDQFTDNTIALDDTYTATAGEGIVFNRCTFSTVTSVVTKVMVGNGDVDFVGSNFDQAQLILPNTSGPAPIVRVFGGHFENPNGSFYDYIQMGAATGNTLTLYGVDFLDDGATPGTRPQVITCNGGKLVINAVTMFSPIAYTHFVTLSGSPNMDLFSFSDLSGNINAGYIGGSTTGFVTSWPGANAGTNTTPNFVMSTGVNAGGSRMHVEGNIRAAYNASMGAGNSGVLVAGVPNGLGIAPFNVSSTVPVTNLNAAPTTYNVSGAQQPNSHIVKDYLALDGTGHGTATFSGNAAFTNSSAFHCVGTDASGVGAVQVDPASATTMTAIGTASHFVSYMCVGF